MNNKIELTERISMVRERIEQACTTSGRKVSSVKLIAVTKTHPVQTAQALIDCGVHDIGENRVQEILEKAPLLRGDYTLHCIGQLQTNKVAKVLPHVSMIQSVDRIRLIDYIERYLPKDIRMPVLVEVNTTGEASKSGCAPSDARQLVERIVEGKRLLLRGFMTVGPLDGDERAVRTAFALLRKTAEDIIDLVPDPQLSMGMSNDFEWAIAEGSTMVRIGTLLFGARN